MLVIYNFKFSKFDMIFLVAMTFSAFLSCTSKTGSYYLLNFGHFPQENSLCRGFVEQTVKPGEVLPTVARRFPVSTSTKKNNSRIVK